MRPNRWLIVFREAKTPRSRHSTKKKAKQICKTANRRQRPRLGYDPFEVMPGQSK